MLLFLCLVTILMNGVHTLKCRCSNNIECKNVDQNTESYCEKQDNINSFCFSRLEYTYDSAYNIFRENRTQGCFNSLEIQQIILCSKDLSNKFRPTFTLCCKNIDHCNSLLIPHLDEVFEEDYFLQKGVSGENQQPTMKNFLVWATFAIGLLAFLTTGILCMVFFTRNKSINGSMNDSEAGIVQEESSISSGSGGGDMRFAQRTLGRDIEFLDTVGKGSFGEVVKGVRKGNVVAVKIFYTIEEKSWQNERQIYYDCHLNHDNILKFIASDIIVANFSCTRLLIVTEFHENGSLYDYIQSHAINDLIALKMIVSMVKGIDYLHDDYKSPDPKPATAHRDLKSKNIMVKRNLECCIADFGLAMLDGDISKDFEIKAQVGTKRYMAPEILSNTLQTDQFRSFLRADIYSLSLIIWEICNRYIESEYILPYYDIVSSDPSIETMKNIVCNKNIRPTIDTAKWNKDVMLKNLLPILKECWHSNPAVRRTALRLRKDLAKIQDDKS